ncbi:MAG TPA: hypothetical protein VGO00_03930 [Kofleriaceae bacterium]|nr:hypothetical protein [Kofleriaceae bacterium]
MQRIISILAVVGSLAMAGCYVESTPTQSPSAASDGDTTFRRPLVTDQLPYQVARADVRHWHVSHGWCLRRTWPSTDEFVVCDQLHPYINSRTPPMYSMTKYDAAGVSIAYATFTPVPCRMYGRCDRIYGRTVYAAEHDFVDHQHGLYDHLADRGRAAQREDVGLPPMQNRMRNALATELDHRFGAPTWQDPGRYGTTWSTQSSEIGLFVGGRGAWVIETHELRGTTEGPPGAVGVR